MQSGLRLCLMNYPFNQVQLLPFHQFGENKYKLLGRKYAMEDVKALHPEDLFEYQDVFLKHDINCYF